MSDGTSTAASGYAHLAVVKVVVVLGALTAAVRFGSTLVGADLGWGTSALYAIGGAFVVLALLGLVVRESPEPESPPVEAREDAAVESEGPARADTLVRLLHDETGLRRVRLFRRRRGGFTFDEEYFSEHPSERCWIPRARGAVGIYETEEIAAREARAAIEWPVTREETPEPES